MIESYGNIGNTSVKQVIKNDKFLRNWNISKDEIEICKDCEYRYCCSDCRVFIDDPKNIYSRPSKCEYNPYLGLWKGEEGYVEVNEWKNLNCKS